MADTASQYPLSDLFKYGAGYQAPGGAIDPETQYFLDKGYLNTSGGGDNPLTFTYNGQNIPGAQVGGKTAAWGSFWQPQGISGTGQTINPAAVVQGTNYGTITPLSNIRHPENTDFMSTWFPLIASSLLGLGGAGAIGAVSGTGGLGGLSGSLLSKVPGLGQTLGGLFSPSAPSAPATQAHPTNASPLLSLLALLGLARGR